MCVALAGVVWLGGEEIEIEVVTDAPVDAAGGGGVAARDVAPTSTAAA